MRKNIEDTLPLDESSKAQAAKTATYALMHLVVAMAVAYALSGSWQVALGIGLIEPAVQTVAYTFHERAWQRRAERRARAESGDAPDAKGGPDPLWRPCGAATRPAAGC